MAYKGDPNIDFMHLYTGDATLYHSGQVNSEIDRLNMEEALTSSNMNRIIYRSDQSVLSQSKEAQDVGSESVSAVSLAMKTKHFPTKNRKVLLFEE